MIDMAQVVKNTLKMRPNKEIVPYTGIPVGQASRGIGGLRGVPSVEGFKPCLPYFSTAQAREAFETYTHAEGDSLRTRPLTSSLWALPGGLFTYTLTSQDYKIYRRQRGVRLITYLVLPSKEVPQWTRG